jgi:hypothetical protein
MAESFMWYRRQESFRPTQPWTLLMVEVNQAGERKITPTSIRIEYVSNPQRILDGAYVLYDGDTEIKRYRVLWRAETRGMQLAAEKYADAPLFAQVAGGE